MYYKNKPLFDSLKSILNAKSKVTMKRALFKKFGVRFKYMTKKDLESIYNQIKYGV